jgi:PST family polysaccharide transporter
MRSILTACLRPFIGGILMTVACELVLRSVGDSLTGLVAAGAAGVVVYLPVVFPMRALLRRPEPESVALDERRAA